MKTNISLLVIFYTFYEVIFSWCIYLLRLVSYALDGNRSSKKPVSVNTPTSVNYHFTRKCNYKCGFCFHTAKTSFVLPIEEAKRGLRVLRETGKRCSNWLKRDREAYIYYISLNSKKYSLH
jgi:hypothetical protein